MNNRPLIVLSILALFLTASSAVMAQTYSADAQSYGSADSSASYQHGSNVLAFPEIPAEQIAADVVTEYNSRTAAPEHVAPTFDPFEEDDRLAAMVNLRSTASARDLNNNRLSDGALLEIELFYTDAGDRDFGHVRDAVFLNGKVVLIVRRDSDELECSSRVTETIYHHDRYYSPGYGGRSGIPPIYFGHRGFDYGYGYGSYGYGRYGPTYPRPRPRSRPKPRPGTDTPTPRLPSIVDDSGQGRPREGSTYYKNGRKAGTKPKPDRRPRRPYRVDPSVTIPSVQPEMVVRPTNRLAPRPDDQVRRRPETRDPAPTVRRRTPSPSIGHVTSPRPGARPVTPRAVRHAPKPAARPPVSRPRPAPPKRETNPKPDRPRLDRPEDRIEKFQMFPGDGRSDSIIVSSERNCARRDQLVLFIPNERLDAARFDGMTLILRDVTYNPRSGQTTVYDEQPLYVPPNYIEGFRIASTRP